MQENVKLMDTGATEGQIRPKQPKLARAYAPQREPRWWCAMLCALLCGCDSLKPAHSRQTAEPPAASEVAQTNNQVVASPPRGTATTTQASPTPQPLAVRTEIVDPPPAPALNPAPAVQPAKGSQKLLVPGVSARAQTSHTVTNSVGGPQTPQSTVTYMPREAAAAIVIKGPPRRPEPPSSRIAVVLCLGMAFGALLIALVFYSKRRFRFPSVRKARREELFLPSEFKLKDSAIQPGVPFGMLAPKKAICPSNMEVFVSAVAGATNAIRFLLSKLPLERVGTAFQAVWQQKSEPLPAISEQTSSKPLSSEVPASKPSEIFDPVASPADNVVQGKPAENPSWATPSTAASAPLEARTEDSVALARSD